jgi:hypothetical protein
LAVDPDVRKAGVNRPLCIDQPSNENPDGRYSTKSTCYNANKRCILMDRAVHQPEGDQGLVEGYELLPPGQYRVKYQRHELISPKGIGGRIIIWFVITEGEFESEEVPYFAAVKILNRKVGTFSCRKSSKYFKMMTVLTNRERTRRDRLPPALLKPLDLTAEVITVRTRKDKTKYDKEDQYSRIEGLWREN